MPVAVLGVDLASGRWRDNGTALLTFEVDGGWTAVDTGVIGWPSHGRPSASELAQRVDAFCREAGVAAVSIDGPQGWRDPAAAPGWGRVADREARTPGKMGPPRSCVPGTYIGWVSLSVELFARFRALAHVDLVNDAVARLERRRGGYYLLESFPTSTWRTAALQPLPAKAKTKDIAPFADDLTRAFGLPPFVATHDELQAVVSALPAAALLGGPARAVARGVPGRLADGEWVEGLIWDAEPARAAAPPPDRLEAPAAPAAPLLVVVSGAPATGKTTLARPLADELRLPLIAKDDLKEPLFDALGTGDRAWSRTLGRATFELQLGVAAELLRAGVDLVLEGNFDTEYDALSRLPPHRPVQIHCTAPPETLLERFAARDRHPGHADVEVLNVLRRGSHDRRSYRLAVDATIDVDTSDAVDVGALARRVRALA